MLRMHARIATQREPHSLQEAHAQVLDTERFARMSVTQAGFQNEDRPPVLAMEMNGMHQN